MRPLLRRLPYDALTAFEFPLASSAGPPDVSARIDSVEQARWSIGRGHSAAADRLLERWAEARREGAGSSVLGDAPSLWLELDARRSRDPEPLLCLRLPADCGRLDPWLEALTEGRATASQVRTFSRALEALPVGARPLYLFDLSPRRAGSLRLELFGIDLAGMPGYLDRLGVRRPGWLPSILDAVGAGERPHLSFDVDTEGEIGDRLGIEVAFARLPHQEPRWRQLASRLAEEKLCSPTVIETVFSWPKQEKLNERSSYSKSLGFIDGHAVRVLSHFKVVGEAGSAPHAKVYLLFQFLAAARRASPAGDGGESYADR